MSERNLIDKSQENDYTVTTVQPGEQRPPEPEFRYSRGDGTPRAFGYIAGLSSALMLDDWVDCKSPIIQGVDAKKYYESLFGDITKLKESDKDYYALVKKIPVKDRPHMYMCIGKDDFLLETNRKYKDYLLEEKVDLTYEEGPGSHEWDFWDRYILKILDWLPLNKKDEGLNSGHVSK